jgi:RNA polymerase sigma-70 factor, ECF subfamily
MTVEGGQLSYSRVVELIRNGDTGAVQYLYTSFRWLRVYFGTKLGWDVADDRYHDLVILVVNAIKGGALRHPALLDCYVRSAARKIAAQEFRARSRTHGHNTNPAFVDSLRDNRPSAETITIRQEAKDLVVRLLKVLPPRDRTVLVRFYVDEHPPEEICSDLNLSATQFRLVKSRAKARLTALMLRRVEQRRAPALFPNTTM